MDIELKQAFDGFQKDWSDFKAANDARLQALEKGKGDALDNVKVDRINDHLSKLDEKIDDLQKKASRPGGGGDGGGASEEDVVYKQKFDGWLRGNVGKDELKAAEKALLAKAGSTSTGGWGNAIPKDVSQTIEARLAKESRIRELVTTETRGSTDVTDLIDLGGSTVAWRGEGDAVGATATPTLTPVTYPGGMLYALPSTTEESLDDLFFNVENWLINGATEGFMEEESNVVITGNGTDKPKGFLAYAFAATDDATRAFGQLQYIPSGLTAAIADDTTMVDAFIAAQAALHGRYTPNAQWLMNKKTLPTIRKLKDQNDQYIFQPALPDGTPSTILGNRYELADDMPVQAANAMAVAFGDFKKAYKLIPIVGQRITRDDVTSKGNVLFYIRKRMLGGVYDSRAVKFIKCATT